MVVISVSFQLSGSFSPSQILPMSSVSVSYNIYDLAYFRFSLNIPKLPLHLPFLKDFIADFISSLVGLFSSTLILDFSFSKYGNESGLSISGGKINGFSLKWSSKYFESSSVFYCSGLIAMKNRVWFCSGENFV